MRGSIRGWVKTVIVRGAAIAIVLAAGQYIFNSDSRARHDDLRADLDRVRGETEELSVQNERLRLQIAGIQHDDRYLEQVARHEFGMIRRGEVLYKFSK